ncbi:MAG: hydrolase [Patescibacteria group bacterium]
MENEQVCCEKFDPALWEEKEITWNNKLFVVDHVTSILHMPLNFGKKMTVNAALIEKAGAKRPTIVMTGEETLWGSNIYIDVDKEIPGAKTTIISGTFLTKVFEGPYQNMGAWIKSMDAYVKGQGKEIKKMYFYYTTCPKCAKKYGKNYVVILAMI